MIILHTNVLSALMHRTVDQRVVSWLDQQPRTSIWITAITLLEVQYGLQILATGKRRSALVGAFDGLLSAIDHLVLPFDEAAAQQAGDLMASRHKKDRPGDLRDTMVAGIALAQHAALATRNTGHFEDLTVAVINPFTA
ncbi:MAG TPA: type II toxin-antitoxin system VapC family toxin [Terriglobales bacterium]|nr:type II toxin-antitoxin system VapC family toxin [Terriglobales bacterium]